MIKRQVDATNAEDSRVQPPKSKLKLADGSAQSQSSKPSSSDSESKVESVVPVPRPSEKTLTFNSFSIKLLSYYEKQLIQPSKRERDDFSYFLPPQLVSIVSSKWRIVAAEKANFGSILKDIQSTSQPRPKKPIPESIMRRSFLLRQREGPLQAQANMTAFPNTFGRYVSGRRLRPPLDSANEMTPDDVRELLSPVHQRLFRLNFGKQWGNPFVKVITPENCASLKVPTYFDFVKEPMNLTWMRDKLKNAQYHSIQEYLADIQLVKKNAQLFNRPGDPVYCFADDLEKKCDDELKAQGYNSGEKAS